MAASPLPPPAWAARLQNTAGALLVALAFAIPLSNALTSVLTALFAATMLAGQAAGSWRWRWRAVGRHPAVRATLALYGSILLAALWSAAAPQALLGQLLRSAALLLLPLFAVALWHTPWPRRCLQAFLLAMGLTLALSLAHALWVRLDAGPWPLPYKGGGDAIFHVHITHNVLMSVAALAWLARACTGRALAWRQRMAYGLLAALAVFDILWLVPGRTGYATLLGGLFVLALVCCPRRWLLHWLGGMAVLCAAALWMSGSVQDRLDRTWREIQAFEGAGSAQRGDVNLADHRLAIWREALQVIGQRPVLGHGTGSYRQAFCASAQPADMCLYSGGKHPHNQWLFAAIEGGLPALAAYAAWVATLGWLLWRQRGLQTMAAAMGPSLWVVWMVYGMVDTPLQLLTERHFFPLFFVLLLSAPQHAPRPVPQSTAG